MELETKFLGTFLLIDTAHMLYQKQFASMWSNQKLLCLCPGEQESNHVYAKPYTSNVDSIGRIPN